MAALAQRATRERLARAIREKGVDKVEGAEEDTLCVICQARPVEFPGFRRKMIVPTMRRISEAPRGTAAAGLVL